MHTWNYEGHVMVDSSAGHVHVRHHGHLLSGTVKLPAGVHRLTWSWHFRSEVPDGTNELESIRGMRLYNITVSNSVGAGIVSCERCPLGSELSDDGFNCVECPAGTHTGLQSVSCLPCRDDSYSHQGSIFCHSCGEGTGVSQGVVDGVDEIGCKPLSVVHSVSGLEFSVQNISNAWNSLFDIQNVGDAAKPLKIGLRQYYISPFARVSQPGGEDNGKKSYIWQVRIENFRPGPDDDCETNFGAKQTLESIGATIASVSSVVEASRRGVLVTYIDADSCEDEQGLPSRVTKIFFRCDPSLPVQPVKDSDGVYHLSTLVSHRTSHSVCKNVSLEWPTASACAVCNTSDYAPEFSKCDGTSQNVTYHQLTPCTGGLPPPESTTQPCTLSVVPGDTGITPLGVLGIVLPILFSLCLCCYAAFLHRKYAKYLTREVNPDL